MIKFIFDAIDHDKHPHVYRCYYCTAIAIYVMHITVSLMHGVQIEGGVTAAAATVELIAHVAGG